MLIAHAENLTARAKSKPPPLARRRLRMKTFFVLACAITWVLAIPAALAWTKHLAPPPYAIACAGLSAFGPLIAAIVVAAPRRELGKVFGRWRTNPLWILAAFFAPAAIHLVTTTLFVLIGGKPDAWFHFPSHWEEIAALIVFPLGEEFGWRGFAHPRMVRRYGFLRGSLALGVVWGLWHLMYAITPDCAGFDLVEFAMNMIELPIYAVLIGWVFERSHRSMAVAIAFHVGAHADHFERASRADMRLHVIHFAVAGVLAILAARSTRFLNEST
jgi:membrane protease YdiL (CAAX protease family)